MARRAREVRPARRAMGQRTDGADSCGADGSRGKAERARQPRGTRAVSEECATTSSRQRSSEDGRRRTRDPSNTSASNRAARQALKARTAGLGDESPTSILELVRRFRPTRIPFSTSRFVEQMNLSLTKRFRALGYFSGPHWLHPFASCVRRVLLNAARRRSKVRDIRDHCLFQATHRARTLRMRDLSVGLKETR